MMNDYLEKQAQIERDMCFRHPWVNLFYNWVIAILVIMLFISFVIWGVDIRTERKAEEMTARALASWQEEQTAEETALRESEEYVMKQEAAVVAKAFQGIKLFIEKYHYSELDLVTYARCMFNRAENGDLISVVSARDQFTGYSDNNQIISEYYDLALRLVDDWHHETVKPCDISYQYAELTPDGIFLKKDIHADAYSRRWHA